MFAIDTNILVYAHNADSKFNQSAYAFLEQVMNPTNLGGKFEVCIPTQVLMEFINVITWDKLPKPLMLSQAVAIAQDYVKSGVPIINQRETHLETFLQLLSGVNSRKKVFDVALAALLKDNAINGIYTVNTRDFKEFQFLTVINPLLESDFSNH